MADDLDRELNMLARAPTHPGLGRIEGEVLDRIAAIESGLSASAGRLQLAATIGALMLGVIGGITPDRSAEARESTALFGKASTLAPSTLLLGPE